MSSAEPGANPICQLATNRVVGVVDPDQPHDPIHLRRVRRTHREIIADRATHRCNSASPSVSRRRLIACCRRPGWRPTLARGVSPRRLIAEQPLVEEQELCHPQRSEAGDVGHGDRYCRLPPHFDRGDGGGAGNQARNVYVQNGRISPVTLQSPVLPQTQRRRITNAGNRRQADVHRWWRRASRRLPSSGPPELAVESYAWLVARSGPGRERSFWRWP